MLLANLVVLVFILTILDAQVGNSLRMINLDAPQIALLGDTIHLSCLFKLADKHRHLVGAPGEKQNQQAQQGNNTNDDQVEGDKELLYAIKWYKDDKEFYRYVVQDWPRKHSLHVDGIQLDVDKSDNQTIVLRSISLRSSGLYKCEVSTDAPHFTTKYIQQRLLVYALPNKGPTIELVKPRSKQLFRGDSVELQCSTPESKPPLTLDWIINDTLNLSSTSTSDNGHHHHQPALAESGRFFNFSSSRFVKLPNLQSGSTMAKLAGKQSHQSMPSPIVYLIQNGSLASPQLPTSTTTSTGGLDSPTLTAKAQAINVTGSLDRLAEISTTRLNFTLDANLSLHLKRLLSSGRRSPPLKIMTSSSRGISSKSSMLRIRCVARVMHLRMSDEIWLSLVLDKSRHEAEVEAEAEKNQVSTAVVQVAKSSSSKAMDTRWIIYTSLFFVHLYISQYLSFSVYLFFTALVVK